MRARTDGRGADAVLVAVPNPALVGEALAIARPGGRVLMFAQNDPEMKIEFPAAAVGVEEKEIMGSYSAAVERSGRISAAGFRAANSGRRIDLASVCTGRNSGRAAIWRRGQPMIP